MTQWTTMTPEAHADWLAAYPRPYSGRMNLESEPRRIEQYDDALGTGEAGLISYGVQGPGGAVSEFKVRSSLIRDEPAIEPEPLAEVEHDALAAVVALIAERDDLEASRDGFKRMFAEAEDDRHAAIARAEAAEAERDEALERARQLDHSYGVQFEKHAKALLRADAAEARVAELEAVLNRAQAALIAGVPG